MTEPKPRNPDTLTRRPKAQGRMLRNPPNETAPPPLHEIPQDRLLCKAAKLRLLKAAVLCVYERRGIPLTDKEEDRFQDEVSYMYRCSLMAQRPVKADTFHQVAMSIAVARKSRGRGKR